MGRQRKRRKFGCSYHGTGCEAVSFVPMDAYKRQKTCYGSAFGRGLRRRRSIYLVQAYVKSGLVFFGALPCLAVIPILVPAFLIMGIGVLFSENRQSRKDCEETAVRPSNMNCQGLWLQSPRNCPLPAVMCYQCWRHIRKTCRSCPEKENCLLATADMRTGSYEAALTRMESRVSSAMVPMWFGG